MEDTDTVVQEYKSVEVSKSIEPYIDVGMLLLEDLGDNDTKELREGDQEEKLLSWSRDNVQYLVAKIWELPTQRMNDVIVAALPKPLTRLPREKPLPKKKPVTKWQQYAKGKGILNRKKSRMVWDELSQTWKPRWGYQRAKDTTGDWVIPIPDQQDPYKDYFGERQQEKKERTAKNELQRMRNIARAQNIPVTGIHSVANTERVEKRAPEELAKNLAIARQSTASVGRFTEKLSKERPPRKLGKRHKFEDNIGSMTKEKDRQLDILKRLDSRKPVLNVDKAMANLKADKNAEAPEDSALESPQKRSKSKSSGKKGSGKRSKRKGAMHAKIKSRFNNKRNATKGKGRGRS